MEKDRKNLTKVLIFDQILSFWVMVLRIYLRTTLLKHIIAQKVVGALNRKLLIKQSRSNKFYFSFARIPKLVIISTKMVCTLVGTHYWIHFFGILWCKLNLAINQNKTQNWPISDNQVITKGKALKIKFCNHSSTAETIMQNQIFSMLCFSKISVEYTLHDCYYI